MSSPQELRVVLLGKTGAGKSSLGNTLLGRDAFLVELGFSSVTFRCQWAEAVRFGTLLQVTDTPGVSDTGRREDEVLKEVGKSIAVASPGPHVVIMVLRCDRRFTPEESNAYKTLKKLFGDNICNHLIVVFAGADGLGAPQEREEALGQLIRTAPGTLMEVLDDAGGRYCSVDNTASRVEKDQQAHTILTAIQDLVSANGGAFFTSPLCEEVHQQVETVVQYRMETADVDTTHEVALRDTRQDIVENRVEPGFFHKLMHVVGDSLVAAAGELTLAAARVAGTVLISSKCSVM